MDDDTTVLLTICAVEGDDDTSVTVNVNDHV